MARRGPDSPLNANPGLYDLGDFSANKCEALFESALRYHVGSFGAGDLSDDECAVLLEPALQHGETPFETGI